ncbi:MAG TPA: hypothetical protein VNA87_06580 [Actinomycetota bacterium]|nr:hypothetical protein [Actinomycetota bacterium]
MTDDEGLLRRAEEVLAELDRNQGLIDEHAEVLAAIRIRLHGGPRKSLDEVIKAAGDLKGKVALEDLEAPKPTSSLDDAFKAPEKKKEWPGL